MGISKTDSEPQVEQLTFRTPTVQDGKDVWQIVQDTGNLDLNSSYAYLLVCDHFADTSIIVCTGSRLVGVVTAYLLPTRPDTLFVWQVAVDATMRGQGLASRMLEQIIKKQRSRIRYIQTTVSPSNEASSRLFDKLAVRLDTRITTKDGFTASLFPEGNHETEPLLTIGPFTPQKEQDMERTQ